MTAAAPSRAAPGWFPATRRGYTQIVAVLTAIMTVALVFAGPIPLGAEVALMVVVVALLGLPHGAFDMEIGRRLLAPRWGRGWSWRFVGLYGFVAALGIAAWFVAPSVRLVLLLVMGVLHWGHEDLETGSRSTAVHLVMAAARGLVPVAVPCAARPEAVAAIFTALRLGAPIDAEVVQTTAAAALLVGAPVLIASLVLAVRQRAGRPPRERWLPVLEVVVLVAWLSVAPPLLGFTVYFCLWHAARHSLASAAAIEPTHPGAAVRGYLFATALPTIATIVIAGIIAVSVPWTAGMSPVLVGVVFIGLFALTIPHVILDLIVERQRVSNA